MLLTKMSKVELKRYRKLKRKAQELKRQQAGPKQEWQPKRLREKVRLGRVAQLRAGTSMLYPPCLSIAEKVLLLGLRKTNFYRADAFQFLPAHKTRARHLRRVFSNLSSEGFLAHTTMSTSAGYQERYKLLPAAEQKLKKFFGHMGIPA